jgi:hypothetical protein
MKLSKQIKITRKPTVIRTVHKTSKKSPDPKIEAEKFKV